MTISELTETIINFGILLILFATEILSLTFLLLVKTSITGQKQNDNSIIKPETESEVTAYEKKMD